MNRVWLHMSVHTCCPDHPRVWYLRLGTAGLWCIALELISLAFIGFVLSPVILNTSQSFRDVPDLIIWISPTPMAEGGFAEVFEDILYTRRVALKRAKRKAADHEAFLRRFKREGTNWGSLEHPHILELLGAIKHDGHIYFISPFMRNGTSKVYVRTHPDVNRIKLLCEAADAIAYIHTCELVHGDIKASNILIDDNGHSLLCDFGLMEAAQTRTSTALRRADTLRWQSPELLSDMPKASASDVYAFGMTVAEVLTVNIPFSHLQTDVAVMYAIAVRGERPPREPVTSSPGISYESVWEIAADCWAPEPEKRIKMVEGLQRLRADASLQPN